jgi:hypothetical protein
MDYSGMSRGTLIAGVSGVLLFIFMFFAWFGLDLQAPEGTEEGILEEAAITRTAWEAFSLIDLILLVAVIVSVGLAVISLTGASVSLPVAGSAVTAGVGALAFLLVLYRLIDPPGVSVLGEDFDPGREVGVWLGLITTAGITYGGYLGMQEEDGSVGEVQDVFEPPRRRDA